jgi:hypothetical protein
VSQLEADNEQLQGSLMQAQQSVKHLERRQAGMEAELLEHQQRVRTRNRGAWLRARMHRSGAAATRTSTRTANTPPNTSAAATLHPPNTQARTALSEQHKLVAEKNALIETVKRLNREVARLEHFKRNLLQQLQDDSEVRVWVLCVGSSRGSHGCSIPAHTMHTRDNRLGRHHTWDPHPRFAGGRVVRAGVEQLCSSGPHHRAPRERGAALC